jgi:Methylamine utilisation protein MauE
VSAVLLFSRCLLGLVFLVSSLSKVRAPVPFVESVRDLRLIPIRQVKAVAVLTIAVEAATVVLLVVPSGTANATGFAMAAVALGAFTAAIVVTVRRGTVAGCRCFGGSAAPFGWHHVVRNGLLLAAAAAGAYASAAGSAPPSLPAGLLAVPAGVVCAALVVRLDDLVDVFSASTTPRGSK